MHNSTNSLYRNDTRTTGNKTRDTYAIVLDTGKKNNNDVLEEIKAAVKSHPTAKTIREIRSIRNEHVLIKTVSRVKILKDVSGLIRNGVGYLDFRPITKRDTGKEVPFLRGMDTDTMAKAIIDALTKLSHACNFKLSELRSFARSAQTITIIANAELVSTLRSQKNL